MGGGEYDDEGTGTISSFADGDKVHVRTDLKLCTGTGTNTYINSRRTFRPC
jgi:hypothetical protein